MLITTLNSILLSIAVAFRRDKSITYSRTTIVTVTITSYLVYNSLDIYFLESGIGIYGGLFYANFNTQIFNLFILLLSGIIISLTGFYPRKL